MSYKYYPYTGTPVYVDDGPNTPTLTVPVSYITVPVNNTVTVWPCELTDECIDRIAEAVVRKLKAGGDGDGV